MYNFTQSKFLGLQETTQASKLAILLKEFIHTSQTNLKDEYLLYLNWLFPKGFHIPSQRWEDHFHYWNSVSGHSKGRLHGENKDRIEQSGSRLPWKVALDSMRSSHNVGSIIRTSDAFGINEVILGGYTPMAQSSLNPSAMGAETWVPLTQKKDLISYLHHQKNEGSTLIGIEINSDSIPFHQENYNSPGILVLGNEERGISPDIQRICDRLIHIPMFGRKFSLNVSCAFAIIASHLRLKLEKNVEII